MEIKKVFQQLDEEFSLFNALCHVKVLGITACFHKIKGAFKEVKKYSSIPAFQQLDDAASHFNVLCHVNVLGITASFHEIRYALIV
jgi:hypothetical protein